MLSTVLVALASAHIALEASGPSTPQGLEGKPAQPVFRTAEQPQGATEDSHLSSDGPPDRDAWLDLLRRRDAAEADTGKPKAGGVEKAEIADPPLGPMDKGKVVEADHRRAPMDSGKVGVLHSDLQNFLAGRVTAVGKADRDQNSGLADAGAVLSRSDMEEATAKLQMKILQEELRQLLLREESRVRRRKEALQRSSSADANTDAADELPVSGETLGVDEGGASRSGVGNAGDTGTEAAAGAGTVDKGPNVPVDGTLRHA